jgi:D-alanyl-D-alanine carboxypeptidase
VPEDGVIVRVLHRRLCALLTASVLITAFCVVSTASAATRSAAKLDAATRAELDKALDAAFAQVNAPGVIVGVRVGNRTWKASRGVSDTATNQPVALDEHTRIGSVTKTFTGTLILQLVDQGKLRLDDTIEKWFPELRDANRITVRELGDMSSGIDSYTSNPTLVNEYLANPTRAWTPEELVAAGTSLGRRFEPGQGFFYSNTNFVMLGLIIEQVTNKPYPQVLQTKVLEPLNLCESSYPDTNRLPVPSWHGYTTQVSANGQPVDSTNWSPTFAAMAGQIISNLDDVMTWAEAVGTGATLTRQTQDSRLQGNPASKSGVREYAFAIGKDNGWLVHDGDIPGFNSQLAYFPKDDITLIVLANSDMSVAGSTATAAPVIFTELAKVLTPSNVP